MNVIISLIMLILSLRYCYLIYRLEYEIPLEVIRINRIDKLKKQKKHLEKKVEYIKNRVFKKDKQKARAYKKLEKLENKIFIINIKLERLENYGQKD